jgi:Holliday junction resolvase RusA-like endonuclease
MRWTADKARFLLPSTFEAGRRKNLFQFWYDGSPKSKKAMKTRDDDAFRDQLRKEFKRKPYRAQLAVSIECFTSHPTPPSIEKIPKNYLDLMNKIVFKDDNQIDYLGIRYHLASNGMERLRFTIGPMGLMRRELNIVSDLSSHDDLEDAEEDPDRIWDDFVRAYRAHQAGKGSPQEQSLLLHLNLAKYQSQQQFLKRSTIQLEDARYFYSTPPGKPRAGRGAFLQTSKEMLYQGQKSIAMGRLRSWLAQSHFKIPQKNGEGEIFEKDVRAKFQDWKRKYPFLDGLVTPIGIEVYYRGPYRNKGFLGDLDNVMMRLAPVVHDELKPPLTFGLGMEAGDEPPFMKDWMSQFPKGLKHQLARYEVFRVPDSLASGADGQIHFVLSDPDTDNLHDRLRKAVDDWQDSGEFKELKRKHCW